LKAGKLSGCVYQDLDNDGIKECGESGVSGVVVTLTGVNDLGAITPITTKTSCDGSYSFTGLRPGTYTITETPPAGFFDGEETVGSLGGIIGTDAITQIFVPSSGNGINYCFANTLGSISGTTYRDITGNGASADDTTMGCVTVKLYKDDGDGVRDSGDTLVATTTTSCSGKYAFTKLMKGLYFVEEVVPCGMMLTAPASGRYVDDLRGSNGIITGNDFYNAKKDNGTASISGTVYHYKNNNGRIDSNESGIAGVKVTLTGITNTGQRITMTVTTDCRGNFKFTKLFAGTYALSIETLPGYPADKQTAGTAGGDVLKNDSITNIVLGADVTATGYLFGEHCGEGAWK
jgi:large repetitive protein